MDGVAALPLLPLGFHRERRYNKPWTGRESMVQTHPRQTTPKAPRPACPPTSGRDRGHDDKGGVWEVPEGAVEATGQKPFDGGNHRDLPRGGDRALVSAKRP